MFIAELCRSGRERKRVDRSIQTTEIIVKPNLYRQVVPDWKYLLRANASEAAMVASSAYKEAQIIIRKPLL